MKAGGKEYALNEGDYVFIPRDAPHAFKNASEISAARMLVMFTPGGPGRFFFEIGRPARPGEPAPRLTPEDIRRALAVTARYRERFDNDNTVSTEGLIT